MNSQYRQLGLVLWGALAWPAAVQAATMIDGGDIGGQVWTAAGSPYIVGKVNGDPTVPAGQELRIEAGTTVLFSGPEDTTLLVQGRLSVNGTATAPVILQAELGAPAIAWQGIAIPRLSSQRRSQHHRCSDPKCSGGSQALGWRRADRSHDFRELPVRD